MNSNQTPKPFEPFRTDSHDLLDQLQPVSGSPFVCPGNVSAVSRSIHLARLNAAWPGCDLCEWRFDSEGLAERTVQETDRIRSQRVEGIRRTEFGVRGQYINDLNRQTAADLTRIFGARLHEQSAVQSLTTDIPRSLNTVRLGEPESNEPDFAQATFQTVAPVIVGYDGRSASVDLAIGVVSASREFGLPVIDIGRCTAASIQEAARSFQTCCGTILVTGADFPAAWAGIDVCDQHGDAVPVVWKDVGIQLQHVSFEAASFLKLQLPDSATRARWTRRLSRHSGPHDVVNFEDRYRDWLLQWYPKQSTLRVLVRTDDASIQQRLTWISQTTGMEIFSRSPHDPTVVPHVTFTMTVPEDDRHFQIMNMKGHLINPERLALALNRAMHSQSSQMTAHADAAARRFWLTNTARSGSQKSTESVCDALAALGLIARLTENRLLRL